MKKFNEAMLISADCVVNAMTESQKTACLEKLTSQQPHIGALVKDVTRFIKEREFRQFFVDLILVIQTMLDAFNIELALITKDELLKQRMLHMLFMASVPDDDDETEVAMLNQYFEQHSEDDLITYVRYTMKEAGFYNANGNDSRIVNLYIDTFALVNCLAEVQVLNHK